MHSYFGHTARFARSRFFEWSVFSQARFEDGLNFFLADFRTNTEFEGAHFQGRALFADLHMIKGWEADLTDASVSQVDHQEGEHQWPPGWATKAQDDLWVLVREGADAVDLGPEAHGA